MLGLGAAAAVGLALPVSTFTTRSVIGVDAPEQTIRLALAQAAREAIISKPVMARAAAALIAAHVAPPDPSLEERTAVLVGIDGVHATGREARLAALLLSKVRATLGDGAASVDVIASDARADVAAQIAGAVADAFLSDHEERVLDTRRQRESDAAARTEALIKTASAAHARLIALGGTVADPAQARAAAAAQTAQAQARADTIRAIIAATNPPLSDRRDIPDSVAALQRVYLDATTKLATARETLGDRHTTVISLRDGVARASTNLTAEWKRLGRIAQSEAEAARARESALRKPDAPADAARRAALEDARAAAQRADDAVARSQAARTEPADEHVYRLYAHAPVPSLANGFSDLGRAALAALAAVLTAAIVVLAPSSRGRKPAPAQVATTLKVAAPARKPKAPVVAVKQEPRTSFFEPEFEDEVAAAPVADDHDDGEDPQPRPTPRPIRVATRREADTGLREAMRTILERLESAEIAGEVATVIVAALDDETATAPTALSLARAASATGRRVLVLEWGGSRAALTAYADPESEPMLLDVFGTLRVALEPAAEADCLMLAPALRNGSRIASGLAREGSATLIDDVAAAFDLVVVDGGRADDTLPIADAYLRVGRYTSRRDDMRFLGQLGAVREAFAGTMVGRVFVTPSVPFPTRGQAGAEAADQPSAERPVPARLRPVERAPMPRRRVATR